MCSASATARSDDGPARRSDDGADARPTGRTDDDGPGWTEAANGSDGPHDDGARRSYAPFHDGHEARHAWNAWHAWHARHALRNAALDGTQWTRWPPVHERSTTAQLRIVDFFLYLVIDSCSVSFYKFVYEYKWPIDTHSNAGLARHALCVFSNPARTEQLDQEFYIRYVGWY